VNPNAKTTYRRLEGRAVKVIGLGGIGAPVAQALAQFLAFGPTNCTLYLIDGDHYEERNRERVLFAGHGNENKAIVKARELSGACGADRLTILPVPRYCTSHSARQLIGNGDVVFLCVDNHASRKIVSNRCRRLNDVVLFSGGNDGIENGRAGTFGNVQVYIRKDGHDITNPLTRFHPEIARPQDKPPGELGCLDLANAAPQLLFTNLVVGSAMVGTFYAWLTGTMGYEELFLDIAQGSMVSIKRRAQRGQTSINRTSNSSSA
jgi:molybdopterin/thiamine biosynthesis adenylyltransferase